MRPDLAADFFQNQRTLQFRQSLALTPARYVERLRGSHGNRVWNQQLPYRFRLRFQQFAEMEYQGEREHARPLRHIHQHGWPKPYAPGRFFRGDTLDQFVQLFFAQRELHVFCPGRWETEHHQSDFGTGEVHFKLSCEHPAKHAATEHAASHRQRDIESRSYTVLSDSDSGWKRHGQGHRNPKFRVI